MALTEEQRKILDQAFSDFKPEPTTTVTDKNTVIRNSIDKVVNDYTPDTIELPENGIVIENPYKDNTSQIIEEQIQQTQSNKPRLTEQPLETLATSAYESGIKPFWNMVRHPIDTTVGLIKLGSGLFEKGLSFLPDFIEEPLFGDREETIKYADGMGNYYKERYGGLDKAKETALTDPVGFLMDLSLVVGGSGKLVEMTGKMANLGKVTKAGQVTAQVGSMLDPINVAFKSMGKLMKAGGKLTKRADPELIEIAARYDIDLPASAVVDDQFTALLEAYSSKSVVGDSIRKRVIQAQDDLARVSDDILKNLDTVDDLTAAGTKIADGFTEYRRIFKETTDALYEPVIAKGKSVQAVTDNTMEVLREIVERKKNVLGGAKDVKFFEDILSDIKAGGKPLKIKELKEGLDKIQKLKEADPLEKLVAEILKEEIVKGNSLLTLKNTRTKVFEQLDKFNDPFTTGNESLLKKLETALTKDMDLTALSDSPELAGQLAKANKAFAEGVNKINSKYGKLIVKNADNPSEIVKVLTDKKMPIEEIDRVYQLIGKENVPIVQANVIKDMFKKAQNTEGYFTPTGLARQIDNYGLERLSKILTEEQLGAVQNISKVAKSFRKLSKITGGSQTGFLNKIQADLRIIGSIVTGVGVGKLNPAVMLVGLGMLLGETALNAFVASKPGQYLLKTGILNMAGQVLESPATRVFQQTERIQEGIEKDVKKEENTKKLDEIFKDFNFETGFEVNRQMTDEEKKEKLDEIFGRPQSKKKESKKITAKDIFLGQNLDYKTALKFENIDIGKNARLARVNNNPGNLRYVGQPGAEQGEGGFARFKTKEDGLKALYNDLLVKVTGNSSAIKNKLGRDAETLREVITVYAPPNENDTDAYVEFVAKKLGVSPDEPIENIVPKLDELTKAVALKESSTTFV